tara:strand:- start:691 stop:1170 length:480 start_codon:yes stop_codon:yes gene_type:complete
MKELWRPVVGLEGKYLVSNVGRVWSVRLNAPLSLVLLAGKYPACNINRKMHKVHHLVAEAWHGPRPEGLLCLHRDDDKLNNTPENLYWGTQSQNMRDCIRNGHRQDQAGTANPSAKLDPDKVRAIRSAEGTCAGIGKQFGIHAQTVSLIKRGKLWATVE